MLLVLGGLSRHQDGTTGIRPRYTSITGRRVSAADILEQVDAICDEPWRWTSLERAGG